MRHTRLPLWPLFIALTLLTLPATAQERLDRPLAHRIDGFRLAVGVGGEVISSFRGTTEWWTAAPGVTGFAGWLYHGAGAGLELGYGPLRFSPSFAGPAAIVEGVVGDFRTFGSVAVGVYWVDNPFLGGGLVPFGVAWRASAGVHVGETPFAVVVRGTVSDDCRGCIDYEGVTYVQSLGVHLMARY